MNKFIKNSLITLALAVSCTAVCICIPQTTNAAWTGWQKDSVGWWYRNSDGSYPAKKWNYIGGKWYYFDNRGYIVHSKWEKIDNEWYYFNSSGHMLANQWIGDYYLGSSGAMLKNTATPDNYIVNTDGKWNRNFSQELVKKAKDFKTELGINGGAYSKKRASLIFSSRHSISYNKATQLLQIIYPNINYADHAKKAAKRYMDDSKKVILSKTKMIYMLTNENQYLFTKNEAVSAINGMVIDFSKQATARLEQIKKHYDNFNSKEANKNTLISEGFTITEAQKAVDTVNIDYAYNAQRTAENTLKEENTTYSKLGLIDYLVTNGRFTRAEAEKGVNRISFDYTINAQKVIKDSYLNVSETTGYPYSKQGLIQQLSGNHWKFTEVEARNAVEKYNINYVERARISAINQLKYGTYAKDGLITYLVNNQKFTSTEATEAVKDLSHPNLVD